MESFKKVISLNQAAKLSGYSQDYLGFLIRQGDIKGVKMGRSWFTTEGEVKKYISKREARSRQKAFREIFSLHRTRNLIIATIIIFIGGFLLSTFINSNKGSSVPEIQTSTVDGGSIQIRN